MIYISAELAVICDNMFMPTVQGWKADNAWSRIKSTELPTKRPQLRTVLNWQRDLIIIHCFALHG